jgi:hypothetical protein
MRSLYFKILAYFWITFLSPGIATSINMYISFLISWILMSNLLLGTVLSVRTCWLHNTVPLLQDLCRPILVHGHTDVSYSVLPLFPCTCLRVVQHRLYIVSLCVVLLSELGMLRQFVPLSNQIIYRVCICYLFLYVIFLLHDTSFAMSDLAPILFHFQLLL